MIDALLKTLTWQRNELNQQLLDIEQLLASLDKKIQEFQQQITGSQSSKTSIIPEQEVARFHFAVVQQQQQSDCFTEKKLALSQQSMIREQRIRLSTTLKMLEKHRDAQQSIQQHQALLTQQNNSDEWIIQRGITT